MIYLLTARDHPGSQGEALRDDLRSAHSEMITARFEAGEVLFGGGVFDDEGVVRGSIIVLDMPSRAAVDAYLTTEPFQTEGLWAEVEIHELKVSARFLEHVGPPRPRT